MFGYDLLQQRGRSRSPLPPIDWIAETELSLAYGQARRQFSSLEALPRLRRLPSSCSEDPDETSWAMSDQFWWDVTAAIVERNAVLAPPPFPWRPTFSTPPPEPLKVEALSFRGGIAATCQRLFEELLHSANQ
jgi:hypothetical protein